MMERKGVEEARARENGWELPVHCIDIRKSAHNDQPFRLHYHDYIELLYGLSGESQAVIGEKSYTMKKGDLIVVNPGEAHDVRVEEGEGNYYVIKFLPELLYSQGKSLVGIRYLLSLWQDEIAFAPAFRAEEIGESGIDECIGEIKREWKARGAGYELIIHASIMRIFVWILRHRCTFTPASSDLPPQTLALLEKTLVEASAHLYESWSAEDAAAFTHLSYSYFSRTFKRAFGISFSAYVEALRLREAEKLLLTTSRTVSDIACALGFNSASYFTERFRLRYGAPPHKFREKLRKMR